MSPTKQCLFDIIVLCNCVHEHYMYFHINKTLGHNYIVIICLLHIIKLEIFYFCSVSHYFPMKLSGANLGGLKSYECKLLWDDRLS